MKCPGCGYESFNLLETCKLCGAPMVATIMAAGTAPGDPAADAPGIHYGPERSAPGQRLPACGRRRKTPEDPLDHGGDLVEMLDDVIVRHDSDTDKVQGTAPGFAGWDNYGDFRPADDADLPGPAYFFHDEEQHDPPAGFEPIIDRDEEIPECYWSPEVAGLGRRALAILVDQSFLTAVLGIFVLGAVVALRLNGVDSGLLLTAAGLRASTVPFALLAVVLSLVYHVFFHGFAGCTPGKALVGIEVRTSGDGTMTWGRAALRWFGAALGLGCAGIGVFWAIFEPRRRGWADMISGTLITRQRGEPAVDVPRR